MYNQSIVRTWSYFLCIGAGTLVKENIGIEKVIKTERICYISFEPINHKSYENTMLPADIVVLFKFKGAQPFILETTLFCR